MQHAYKKFREADYAQPLGSLPVKVQAAVKRYAGSQFDVMEIAKKKVDETETFAVYVPGTDSGDVRIFDAHGKTLSDGTIQAGNRTFDWNVLATPPAPPNI